MIEAKPGTKGHPTAREKAIRLFRLGIIAFFAGTALLLPGCGQSRHGASVNASAAPAAHCGTACAVTRVVER